MVFTDKTTLLLSGHSSVSNGIGNSTYASDLVNNGYFKRVSLNFYGLEKWNSLKLKVHE